MNGWVHRSDLRVAGRSGIAVLLTSLCLILCSSFGFAQDPGIEFFEAKIRPLLADRCYECHSGASEELQGGLRLDHGTALRSGGDSGPAVAPGKPDESLLIRAVRYEENEMPPDGRLSEDEIRLLERWVKMGAPWPEEAHGPLSDTEHDYDWEQLRADHWAFRPVASPQVPSSGESSWPQNDIDRFIQARRQAAGLAASEPAESRVLVRRIYLDLIGLPPSPADTDAFRRAAAADRPSAVANLVDRLLQSPQYGERWGRHWLDVARFSDGLGGSTNPQANHQAWRYRDWVIQALNDDMPYDHFVRLQIAGDLLEGHTAAVATGLFALGPVYSSDGGDPDSIAQAKGETLDDRVDTLSRGLLALTASCARCHDHKFDPIPQQDYYSLAGIFNNTTIGETPLADADVVAAWDQQSAAISELARQVKELNELAKKEKRELSEAEQSQMTQWKAERQQREQALPPKYPVAHALRDSGDVHMQVAIRGNLRKSGQEAPRRFLKIIAGDDRTTYSGGSGRVQLAAAVTSRTNPLTARVIVNRIWMHHFGHALVRTPANFGVTGELPTHPLLLDWLAAEFMDGNWSVKELHRTIMTSATYQQSSRMHESSFAQDGDNRLLWRMNPRRMDVEVWRDSLLSVTDELDLSMGGPPFDDLTRSRRRTLYARVSRNGDQVPADGFLRLFDFPLMRATIAQRPVSIVPQQFLFMLNSEFMVQRAQAFVERLPSLEADPDVWIHDAYRLLFGRRPTNEEAAVGRQFLAAESVDSGTVEKLPRSVQYAQVLLCSSEFMYIR